MGGDLIGRVAVVTGGSRGLGRAIAIDLAKRGAFVVVNYRVNYKAASETLERIESLGGKGRIYQTSVDEPDAVQRMFQEIYKDHQKVDVLINNAGITRDEYFIMMRQKSWSEVLKTNLDGVYYCTKAVIRAMCIARRGVIINIGSGSAMVAMPGQANYCAAKAALLGLTRTLAREVADKGVRVLCVAPGYFETDMAAVVPQDIVAESLIVTPLRRWGKPEELTDVVGYLVSEDAEYITGQTIVVDGGRGAVELEYGF